MTRRWCLLGCLVLAGCGQGPADAPMSGYAEADLVYVAPSASGVLQTVAVRRGDKVARGQALYARHGCAGCHDAAAPDLKQVAVNRSADELRQSILDPNSDVPSAYWRAKATLRNGQTLSGARLNEDTFTVQLRTREGLRSLFKSDIERLELDRSSPMPSFQGKLTAAEVDDLLAYLSRGAK